MASSTHILKHPLTILFSICFGALLGVYSGEFIVPLGILSDVYLAFFQMSVIPILVTSIISSLAVLIKDPQAKQYIAKIATVFILSLAASAVFGVCAGIWGKPGNFPGMQKTDALNAIIKTAQNDAQETMCLETEHTFAEENRTDAVSRFLLDIVPSNIFASLSSGTILQIVFFSIILGIALGCLPEKQSVIIIETAKSFQTAFQKLIGWTMYALPFALVFLVGRQIALTGADIFLAMLRFIAVFFAAGGALIVCCFFCIWFCSGTKNPAEVIHALIEPTVVPLATRNSFASMPAAVSALNTLNFDRRSSNLVFPLGLTILRFGNIVYFAVASCCVAQIYNAPVSFNELPAYIFGSLFAGTATAGASGIATLQMIHIVLDPLGLPAESLFTVFLAIDALVDPMRTLINVFMNMSITAVIAANTKANSMRGGSGKSADKKRLFFPFFTGFKNIHP
ncbi:MAG: dicarboxylate/amino acid:cation symporter [Bacteroides sp.]|nr:dicarboxylate/amino acid:cation symporter [Prevotella sp.]MCM1406915.1 dicarboxylate/amino acid:cation symporter [Treponema brennaborense]MCM1470066.1 dicarboxylate/amino acid:cation symporter [Bacteroides sp.]